VLALVGDDAPLDALHRSCGTVEDPWSLVPTGLVDPSMQDAAESCLTLAADLLDAVPPEGPSGGPGGGHAVRAFVGRRRASGWAPAVTDLQSLDQLELEAP